MVDRSTEHRRDEHMRCTLLVSRKCFAATTHKEQNEDVDMGGEGEREDTRHISHM